MKKSIFLAILGLASYVVASAQNQFVATLQHGENVSNFYGSDALKKAYNASETGDIITLSSGAFNSCNIEKGITVRGAGLNAEMKTEVNGNLSVYSTDESWTTTFEGLKLNNTVYVYNKNVGTAGKVVFEKNYINRLEVSYNSGVTETNAPLVTVINNYVGFIYTRNYTKFTAYNSIFTNGNTDRSEYSNPTFYNCLFVSTNSSSSDFFRYLDYSIPNNCIFYNNSDYDYYTKLPSSCVATNCLGIHPRSYNAFDNLPAGASSNNSMETKITEIFETFTGEFTSFAELYKLTEKGKSYKGFDGTEVGVQGGLSPYTLHVQYPVISKFQADAKAGTDGKLNVSIEVTNGK